MIDHTLIARLRRSYVSDSAAVSDIGLYRHTVRKSLIFPKLAVFGAPCEVVPNLSGRRLDVYHTATHGVALVRI